MMMVIGKQNNKEKHNTTVRSEAESKRVRDCTTINQYAAP